jgi:hypothetical protein
MDDIANEDSGRINWTIALLIYMVHILINELLITRGQRDSWKSRALTVEAEHSRFRRRFYLLKRLLGMHVQAYFTTPDDNFPSTLEDHRKVIAGIRDFCGPHFAVLNKKKQPPVKKMKRKKLK